MKRKATAVWNGSIKEGEGHISTESKVLDQTQYSFKSRFANGLGTNPEELLAAAHAGCFTMKLSLSLTEIGFTAEELQTTAVVSLEDGIITASHLIVFAKIPNIGEDQFQTAVKDAELNCPVSKVLNAKISVESTLEN